jgi:hypothetical protein
LLIGVLSSPSGTRSSTRLPRRTWGEFSSDSSLTEWGRCRALEAEGAKRALAARPPSTEGSPVLSTAVRLRSLRAGTVCPWKFLDRCIAGRGCEEAKSCVEYLGLALGIVRCTHRPSEWVPDDQCPRELHFPCPVSERLRDDGHRWDTGILDRPCDVSDRHVAHRSDGDEERQIDLLCPYPLQPIGELPAQPAVGCCSRVRVEGRCQRADSAISIGLTQSVDG